MTDCDWTWPVLPVLRSAEAIVVLWWAERENRDVATRERVSLVSGVLTTAPHRARRLIPQT